MMFASIKTLFICNKQGEQYAETEVSCETLAQRCNDKHCPLGVFGCPFSDGIDCTKITPLHWQIYLAYPGGLPPMNDE